MNAKKLIPANVFLLTHKCGNNYIGKTVGRYCSKLPNVGFEAVSNKALVGITEFNHSFVNIRGRHYMPQDIDQLLTLIDPDRSRFFLFTRHPASFFRSATKYHLRGPEEWAKTIKIPQLENKTLFDALTSKSTYSEQLMLSMTYWGDIVQVINRWVRLIHYFRSTNLFFRQIKCEDLWLTGDEEYFQNLATDMSHDGFMVDSNTLLAHSPITLNELPTHSTGEFMESPYAGYDENNLQNYFVKYGETEKVLGY